MFRPACQATTFISSTNSSRAADVITALASRRTAIQSRGCRMAFAVYFTAASITRPLAQPVFLIAVLPKKAGSLLNFLVSRGGATAIFCVITRKRTLYGASGGGPAKAGAPFGFTTAAIISPGRARIYFATPRFTSSFRTLSRASGKIKESNQWRTFKNCLLFPVCAGKKID